jgi:hypothetical protein
LHNPHPTIPKRSRNSSPKGSLPVVNSLPSEGINIYPEKPDRPDKLKKREKPDKREKPEKPEKLEKPDEQLL